MPEIPIRLPKRIIRGPRIVPNKGGGFEARRPRDSETTSNKNKSEDSRSSPDRDNLPLAKDAEDIAMHTGKTREALIMLKTHADGGKMWEQKGNDLISADPKNRDQVLKGIDMKRLGLQAQFARLEKELNSQTPRKKKETDSLRREYSRVQSALVELNSGKIEVGGNTIEFDASKLTGAKSFCKDLLEAMDIEVDTAMEANPGLMLNTINEQSEELVRDPQRREKMMRTMVDNHALTQGQADEVSKMFALQHGKDISKSAAKMTGMFSVIFLYLAYQNVNREQKMQQQQR